MFLLYILTFIILLFITYVIFLVICALLVNPKKEYDNHSRFYRALLNSATAFALKIMRVRIHTEGIEKIPTLDKNILFVGNHRSNFDPIITWHILKKWQVAFISKRANFKIFIFGRFIRRCCFMAIDRENPRNAIKTINRAAELLKKGEVSIGVYPEGTRSKSCVLLPFHNGVFKIAQKANAPIVTISIDGSEKIHKNFPFHHTDVYLKVVDIIESNAVHDLKTDAIGERVYKKLQDELDKSPNRKD